jgi:hypothetical protein
MKTLSDSSISVAFLFCFMWQNTYSQLLYPHKEIGNPPPYDPNIVIISLEVEKWMNEQFGSDDRIWVAWMTAEEISKLAKNYGELAISDYKEPQESASPASIFSLLKESFASYDKNSKVFLGYHMRENF